MSRGNNQGPAPQAHSQAAHHPAQGRRKHIDWATRTIRIEIFVVLVGCALLLAAVSVFLALSGGLNNEEKLVNASKYQAVFLNGGSISGAVTYSTYFGHVAALNSKYMILDDVYYLTTDQSTQTTGASTSPQLIKLGCQQLHSPYDRMVINRGQVAFWENLQDSGKVATAIKQYIKQNPNGPDCTATSSGSSQPATAPANSTSGSSSKSTTTSGQ